MSSYQFGKSGLTLLSLYIVLEVLTGGVSAVATVVQLPGDGELTIEFASVAVVSLIAAVLIFGALPASILIWNRERLARRWFADDERQVGGLSSRQLLQVGVVLLGLTIVIGGGAGLLVTLATGFSSRRIESEAAESIVATAGAAALGDAARLVLGLLLVRFSKRLSERWIE